MKKLSLASSLLVLGVLAGLVVGSPALAQRRIIGTDEAAPDAGPPPAEGDKKDDKKDKKKGDKKDEKKEEPKKEEPKKEEPKKEEPKKEEPKKGDKKEEAKKGDKKDEPKGDILEETDAEKKKREEDEAKKKAAEKAADEAAEKERLKKEEEQKKLLEEKKAADQKRKLENRDARLAAAKKVRQITRTSGSIGASFAIEPGEVKPGSVAEVRVDLAKKLDKADPRFGTLEPQKGMNVVALVTEPGSKKPVHYVMHALDVPGRYGFHFTPTKAGAYAIAIEAKGKASVDANFTLHVGTWPPPDFDDEEKNNQASADDAARTGRKLIGGGN